MRHWLMKSEPEVFSISDLKRVGQSSWDGVRNYQARNFMMKDMQVGDPVIFYHSNASPPGAAGLAKVSAQATPDLSQFERKSEYFDPKASKEKPVWYCVRVEFEAEFPEVLSLAAIRENRRLKDLPLLQRGQRLSIQPLSAVQFEVLVAMANGESR
jgi:predicted RNA-binding protein with PUA-like domain